eukprot:2465071-Pleurochrysis_carterae.AAC.1
MSLALACCVAAASCRPRSPHFLPNYFRSAVVGLGAGQGHPPAGSPRRCLLVLEAFSHSVPPREQRS